MVAPLWPPRIPVENPDELLGTGEFGAGALIRLQSSATEGGVYADVAGVGSTPTIALVTATRLYTGYDVAATTTTWFRWRFENAGGTKVSDWTTPVQVSATEEAGQLCSLFDARQRLGNAVTDTSADEDIYEFIRQVSADIQGYTGRRFARTPAASEDTFYFDVDRTSRELSIPAGIASMSVLEVAQSSQPTSGGTFTTVATTDWFLRPLIAQRDYGWPATRVCILDTAASYFHPGHNTVRATMALGWTVVPPDITNIALTTVVRRWKARQSGQSEVIGGSEFGGRVMRWISPEEREKLDFYRLIPTDAR